MLLQRLPDQAALHGSGVCAVQVGREERGVLAAV